MTTEARIVAPQRKIGSRPTGGSTPAPEAPEPPQGGRGRKLGIIIGVAVVAIAAAAYWFLVGPGAASGEVEAGAEAAAEEHVELGPVQVVDSISINLAGGHYLRLGLGLQLSADNHGELDAAKALDAAIALFSGRTQEELADSATREALKVELSENLAEIYEGEVVSVYYTDFVTQ